MATGGGIMADELFDGLPEQLAPDRPRGAPRLVEADRHQVRLQPVDLDQQLPRDHLARLVWRFVERLDLSAIHDAVRARDGRAGRPMTDPRIMVALWLYATIDGIGSARVLARLCRDHVVYRWLCGGVGTNAHTLSDFRVAHAAVLDKILTTSVTALVTSGQASLTELAQDGVRIRANAGASSFRRRQTLEERVAARVAQLKSEVDADSTASTRRAQAARERADRDIEARTERALAAATALEGDRKARAVRRGKKGNEKKKPSDARASTTDPQARVMKMADGGFRPAYNVQVVSDPQAQVIVEVTVETTGSDRGLARKGLERVKRRFNRTPARYLVDGGFTSAADIEWAHSSEGGEVEIVCPPIKNKHGSAPETPRPDDGPGVADWRRRLTTPEFADAYRRRGPHECINAHLRNRGLTRLLVRGVEKVRAVMLWHAIAHNMMRSFALATA
jgi:transposase